MRPISNVVDVTNYVLLERNQPLHAFDLARLAGRGIVVRLAGDGETITTLDGVERALTAEDLLICDAERAPQAIAGIMGGSTSEVSDDTTEILLESAYFERMGIARTLEAAQAAQRVERPLRAGDRPRCGRAQRRAGHGAARRGRRRPGRARRRRRRTRRRSSAPRIRVRTEPGQRGARHRPRRRRRVGRARSARDRARRCGGDRANDGRADASVATVPTFRPDLEREIDLVEEVARRIGFDRIGRTLPDTHGQVGMLTTRQQRATAGRRRARRHRAVRGDHPARWSRRPTSSVPARRSIGIVRAANPLRAEESVLRTADPPRAAARRRLQPRRTGSPTSRCSRPGRVFRRRRRRPSPTPSDEAPSSRTSPSTSRLASAGSVRRRPVEDDRAVDVYDAVDALRAVARRARIDDLALEAADVAGFRRRPRRAGARRWSSRSAMSVRSPPTVVAALGLDGPVVAVRARARRPVRSAPAATGASRALSRFPASTIDLAFVADDVGARRRDRAHAAHCDSATCSRTSACSTCSRPTRSGAAAAASRSRCASAPPTARSPTPRSARLRQQGDRRRRRARTARELRG